ncbi:GH92 family glycosyl hydrolase [Lentzea aerocolonigenes]|uniref:GH92 family glycosyl hydrolase n=1 Tax=Lentzea aerocolonigenes TaxID=68170 RepID=UPI0006991B06|nr:GH92 family glycosyl hydrolase [Lentzea aerocolonigenes]
MAVLLVLGVPAPPAQAISLVTDPVSLVDPMIGTGNGGETVGQINNFPGPAVPFGMLQWSPDTPGAYAGYSYDSTKIRGFSLTHASVGCTQYGDVPILPVAGEIGPAPWNRTESFSHSTEIAKAGEYAVTLADSNVRVDMASATRTGLSAYTFPATDQARVLIKAGASLNGDKAASVRTVGDREVVGSAVTGDFCGKKHSYTIYYSLMFDRPFTTVGSWDGTAVSPPGSSFDVSGPRSGGYLTFDTRADQTVRAKVAISYVGIEGAQRNMREEIPGWDLAPIKADAREQWHDDLSRIEIGGGTAEQQRTFYTALYHSLLYPTTFSDVDGRYVGFDSKIYSVSGRQRVQYANYSLWDTYRCLAALQALLRPDIASDLAQSLVNDAVHFGWLPKWPVMNSESGVMSGDNATPFLASLHAFGARNFDTATALQYMVKGATTPAPPGFPYQQRQGVVDYQKFGYVPNDRAEQGHVRLGGSQTLEYALDDFSISQFAAALGKPDMARTYAVRGQNWQNVFDGGTGYLRPKDSVGAFPSGPGFVAPQPGRFGQDGFDEGNAAQYNYFVQQNMAGLIRAMGGRDAVNKRADTFFQQLNVGPNAPYQWSGNEVDFATPWLYDYTGQPWKTQEVVRRIEKQLFSATPNGEPGNDDLGAQSSWYVWAALGLYPVTPGTSDLALASPLFSKAVVHLANGRSITINAPDAATDRPYVRRLTLNGRSWDRTYLPPSVLRDGATLGFDLSATPNTSWATSPNAAPPSYSEGQAGAIGYTSPTGQVVAGAGTTFPLTVGVVDADGRSDVVRWTAEPPAGITVTPSSGVLSGRASQQVTVAVNAPSGYHSVPVHFTDETGRALPGGTIKVTVPAADGRATVCADLAATDTECGLQRLDNGDGHSEPVSVAGRSARRTLDGYLYFAVTDDLVPAGSAHAAAITVDYLDQGTGQWNVQYDSTGQPYQGSASWTNTGTGTWQTATFTLPDAGFSNRQNAGADFRLSTGPGFVISRVHVGVSGGSVLPLHLCPS